MNMARWRVLLALALGIALLGGCGAAPLNPSVAVMMSPDVTIVGSNYKFVADQAVPVPISLPVWEQDPADDMVNLHTKWERLGAQRVRVVVGGRTPSLYGLISFHKIPADSTGPATRSFSIHIDHSYLDQATDGRISVVYELVPRKSGGHAYAWVLWMSDRPF
jgi:hypothetical protein